jgi:hypothetical protein
LHTLLLVLVSSGCRFLASSNCWFLVGAAAAAYSIILSVFLRPGARWTLLLGRRLEVMTEKPSSHAVQ